MMENPIVLNNYKSLANFSTRDIKPKKFLADA